MRNSKTNDSELTEMPVSLQGAQLELLLKSGKIIVQDGKQYATKGLTLQQVKFLAQNQGIYPILEHITKKRFHALLKDVRTVIQFHTGHLYTNSLSLAQRIVHSHWFSYFNRNAHLQDHRSLDDLFSYFDK